ncbi:hypothetical protein QVN81_01325 [Prevotella lascolaii]|uniref:Uncharacterized protein n=1 Tax=Leyella lascolaii TaxID=1776379 RepID=A0AAW7JIH2_9BACT|nr:hypothetical protein [Leyella lascolaii]MDN0021667.1 hypothetical protein [Leyella lascolaii]MDN0024163.1 hypothetical protein [Leyella lascolaii]
MIDAIMWLSFVFLLLGRRKGTLLIEVIIRLSLLRLLLVRRKILRLYLAAAVIVLNWECRYIMRGQTKGMVRQFAEDG